MTLADLNRKPDYILLLEELYGLTINEGKRHADLMSSELGFTRQKTAAMLTVLVNGGYAETFTEWINGDHLGNNYNLTVAGANLLGQTGWDVTELLDRYQVQPNNGLFF